MSSLAFVFSSVCFCVSAFISRSVIALISSICSRIASLISSTAHNDVRIVIRPGLCIRAEWVMENVLTFFMLWCSSLPCVSLCACCNWIPLLSIWGSRENMTYCISLFLLVCAILKSVNVASDITERFYFMASVGYETMLWMLKAHQYMPTHATC